MAKPYWFTRIAKESRASGFKPNLGRNRMGQEAIDWFRERAARVRNIDVKRLTTDTPSRMFSRVTQEYVGQMLMFFYNPKYRDTLPFYDRFPLVFPMEFYGDSMLSINLHYLPFLLRAQLMNALYTVAETEENSKIKRLDISYQILNASARFAPFRPCIKKHLFSHVQSRFFWVRPEEWDMALMLPTARFQKATQEQVWADSQQKIQGH